MKCTFDLDYAPIGFALSSARSGEPVQVATSAFSCSEDGPEFQSRLDAFADMFLHRLPKAVAARASRFDHFIVVVEPTLRCQAYVDEFPLLVDVISKRDISAGDEVFEDDFSEIRELHFGDLEIAPSSGFFILFSCRWRRGFYYDVDPLQPNGRAREVDVWKLLGGFYNLLEFSQLFHLSEEDWERLRAAGWFLFVGLTRKTNFALLQHVRAGWDPDDLAHQAADELRARLPGMLKAWSHHPLLQAHCAFLESAARHFQANDFLSSTSVLYPRIEGLLRSISGPEGTRPKQAELAAKAERNFDHEFPEYSSVFPKRFREFLIDTYFKNFSESNSSELSRNTLAHGVAGIQSFSLKQAVIGLLIVEQLAHHFPRKRRRIRAVSDEET